MIDKSIKGNNRPHLLFGHDSRSISVSSDCRNCGVHSVMSLSSIRTGFDRCLQPKVDSLLHVLALTDCSNCFSAVMNVGVKCLDKGARLQMAYIRDAQSLITVSYICGVFNVADVGAKQYSNLPLWTKLVRTGRFEIAFMAQKDAKILVDRQKSELKQESRRKNARLNL